MDDLLQCRPPGSLVDRVLRGEHHLYRDKPIQCQSDNGNYACSRGGVAMPGSDGMGSSTRVLVAWCMWVPVVASCPVWH
jgi:hypothetical protein